MRDWVLFRLCAIYFYFLKKLLKRIKLRNFNSTTLIIPLNISKTEQYELNLKAIETSIHLLYIHIYVFISTYSYVSIHIWVLLYVDHRILHQCFNDWNNVALVVLFMDIYTPACEYIYLYIFGGKYIYIYFFWGLSPMQFGTRFLAAG